MRKLIGGASIILVIIFIYGLRKAAFEEHQVKSTPATAVATTATRSPNMPLASTTPIPAPTPESTPTPILVSINALEPLKSRVVKHQPDQFRKGAISKEEFAAIEKAIKIIPWSRNSNPEAAADEDYAAIVKVCEKSNVHDLLTDLIAEAVSNDYQPNKEAANSAYSTELTSDFENGHRRDGGHGKSGGEITAEQPTSIDSGSASRNSQCQGRADATSWFPAERPSAAEVIRSIGHVRHRFAVRHRIVDVKMRLIALWHQSLARAEKSSNWKLFLNSQGGETKK